MMKGSKGVKNWERNWVRAKTRLVIDFQLLKGISIGNEFCFVTFWHMNAKKKGGSRCY